MANIAFNFIKMDIDRDTEKWLSTVKRNRHNGSKGGRPKNENPEKPIKPSGLLDNPKKPTKPEYDNDYDNEDDYDNDYDSRKKLLLTENQRKMNFLCSSRIELIS